VGAHTDPVDFPIASDNKRCAPREIDRVDPESLMHAESSRDLSLLVKENGKRIRVVFEVLLSFEEALDFLCSYEQHRRVALLEFLMSGLNLSQLVLAVRSPGATDENERHGPATVAGKPNNLPIDFRKRKIGRRVAHTEGTRGCSQHCYNFDLSTSIL
jgi:hypothetical protein